jgi:hypothetical protein
MRQFEVEIRQLDKEYQETIEDVRSKADGRLPREALRSHSRNSEVR